MSPLNALLQWLQSHELDGFIVPSNDPHFSEYVAPHWGARAWLSCFDGSAGTLAIAPNAAALWTDSRYFLQAEAQLSGTGVELQRLGLPDTPSIAGWFAEKFPKTGRIGVDGSLFSKNQFEALKLEFAPLELIATADPFAEVWPSRPPFPAGRASLLDTQYSGEATASKLARIRSGDPAGTTRLVTLLDEIAWTLNLRGSDIDNNPFLISYLAIEPDAVRLFADGTKFADNDRKSLAAQGVEILPYDQFPHYLQTLRGQCVAIHPDAFPYGLFQQMAGQGIDIRFDAKPYGPITALKALKNATELAGFRRAAELDGVALVRFERWLEAEIAHGNRPHEAEIAAQIVRLRSGVDPGYRSESFPPIVGYGPNGAIVHYHASPQGSAPVGIDNLLLVDSGGQYLYGTTDITRTYHFGTPTPEQARDYTLVLKGMIALSSARFPQGTRGAQLDVLARQFLWQQGVNYGHGTGHGIGHFLGVHEGPQSIRMNENPVMLEAGMVQSCEPGLYRAGQHGVRIENMLAVVAAPQAGFFEFETLTLCPIATRPIDRSLLSLEEKEWIDRYHATVYERLAPLLSAEEAAWLREKTKPL